MSTTEITVTGNVVTPPSRVRTQNGSVTNFRIAATERRYDSTVQGFVDGASFFVDVECWGELSGNVAHSVTKGDPLVVRGTLRTHEWESEQGRRSRPQLRAQAVGFDLSRGIAEFRKTRRSSTAAPSEPLPSEPSAGEDDGRDYVGAVAPLYELDPDSSAPGGALDARPEPASH